MVDWRLTAKSLFVCASYRVGALWRSVEARVEERFVVRTACQAWGMLWKTVVAALT
jgi:hypothetical protein